MVSKDINIIIPVLGNSSWIGGLTYQENLIEALRTVPDVNITLMNELDYVNASSNNLPFSKRILSTSKKRFNGVLNRVSSWSKNYDTSLQKKLDEGMNGRINAIFTLNEAHLRGKNNIIKLYWIPDFQQLHLKHFFNKEEMERRSSRYMEGCALADIVIVSSDNVKKDLEKFAPQYLHKCRVSSFVSSIPSFIWEANPEVTVNTYSLPEKFFFLPNQVWKHKNHKTVFEALHLLRKENVIPNLVCTGNPNDHRDPNFYKDLLKLAEDWKIKDQIRFLGMVPYEDVLILIRQSIAVINPSLFEGWSTTVEESKSIGKQLILSDIIVHREQQPPCTTYFDPLNAAQLAEILKAKWNTLKPGPDAEMESRARLQLNERKKKYAETFIGIILECEKQKTVKA